MRSRCKIQTGGKTTSDSDGAGGLLGSVQIRGNTLVDIGVFEQGVRQVEDHCGSSVNALKFSPIPAQHQSGERSTL